MQRSLPIFVRGLTILSLTVMAPMLPAQSGMIWRVSLTDSGQQANGSSGAAGPSLSRNGRFVAFESNATNLVPGDKNNDFDIYVRDRELGRTYQASVSSDGQQFNGFS